MAETDYDRMVREANDVAAQRRVIELGQKRAPFRDIPIEQYFPDYAPPPDERSAFRKYVLDPIVAGYQLKQDPRTYIGALGYPVALARRAFGSAEQLAQGGAYDPSPGVETMLAMLGARTPRAGELGVAGGMPGRSTPLWPWEQPIVDVSKPPAQLIAAQRPLIGVTRPPIVASTPLVGAEQMPGLSSTRKPTAARATENPLTDYLQPNMDVVRRDPALFDRMMREMADIPGLPPNLRTASDPREIEQILRQHLADNLLSIYHAQPEVVKQFAPWWYEGANVFTGNLAKQYGLPHVSTAGATAALSPGLRWDVNADLARRVIDTVASGGERAKGGVFDSKMEDAARRFGADAADIKRIKGSPLADLADPADAALWVRAYDEAHNPSSYRYILPTGEPGRVATTKAGDEGKISWTTFPFIANAIKAVRSGGDPAIISQALGGSHKVPSFHNNILYPNSPLGDVTSDTHNIAGAVMLPLGRKHEIVQQGLGSAGPENSILGIKGMYPLFADATRDAAIRAGVIPRAMQSVSWEGIKGLFSPEFKRSQLTNPSVADIWSWPGVDPATKRMLIIKEAGGYRKPDWAREMER